jgi:HD-GYP domain-containing protein (c-di-GMP phosphodiesterase class II)
VPDGRIYGSMKGLIEVIAETIELRGPYTAGHHERVSGLAVAIAREMGLTDLQVEGIELASAVYDIGTVNIPADILREGERLEGIALSLYQAYPGNTYDMLKKVEFLWPIADIVHQHRECYDGSGFPRGIKGEETLVEARILAVAAALDDLTTRRSFRDAFPLSEALEKMSSHSGSKYDPEVVAACLKLFREKGFKMEG